jgi:small multidrug resistance pump
MPWLFLMGAILCEIVATSALKASNGFSRPPPTGLLLVGYCAAFYCLSAALRTIPMGSPMPCRTGKWVFFTDCWPSGRSPA